MNGKKIFSLLIVCTVLSACVSETKPPENLLSLTDSQMKIRSYQSRSFDISDQGKALRGVIAALLDLGFIVERVNSQLGLVTAGKFADSGSTGFVELTVIVLPKGDKQTEVRVNALYNTKPIEDPKVYQNFFITVQRSFFTPG